MLNAFSLISQFTQKNIRYYTFTAEIKWLCVYQNKFLLECYGYGYRFAILSNSNFSGEILFIKRLLLPPVIGSPVGNFNRKAST